MYKELENKGHWLLLLQKEILKGDLIFYLFIHPQKFWDCG